VRDFASIFDTFDELWFRNGAA